MNKVYLMGTVTHDPRLVSNESAPAHLTLLLRVEHQAKTGSKQEYYPVNAWNQTAQWGAQQLAQGQQVLVEGYLTQRVRPEGFVQIQLTATRFHLQGAKPEPRQACPMDSLQPEAEAC